VLPSSSGRPTELAKPGCVFWPTVARSAPENHPPAGGPGDFWPDRDTTSFNVWGFCGCGDPLPKELKDQLFHVLFLAGTNLKGANLTSAVLIDADFYALEKVGESIQTTTADLTKADLSKAALQGANLSECLLKEATLTDAALQSADLSSADLQGADLSSAALQNADLSPATVPGLLPGLLPKMPTNLTDADLSNADLTDATGWTMEQLTAARSLKGATMPDGQILRSADNPDGSTLEEWLKGKGREEDGENSKPS